MKIVRFLDIRFLDYLLEFIDTELLYINIIVVPYIFNKNV